MMKSCEHIVTSEEINGGSDKDWDGMCIETEFLPLMWQALFAKTLYLHW